MIHWTSGDIFDSDAPYLVNPVNCVGVSGKGLALAFKKAFPTEQKAYEAHARAGKLAPGRLFCAGRVIYLPTKRHFRDKSRLDDLIEGLKALRHLSEANHWPKVAIPALGCGLGGLGWPVVSAEIDRILAESPVEFDVYEPK